MWIEIARNGVWVYIQSKSYKRIYDIVTPYFECRVLDDEKLMKSNSWKILHEYKIKENMIEIIPHIEGDKEPKRKYYVDKQNKTIIIAEPTSKEFVLQISIRLARDIIKHTLMQEGYCFLHGGMIVYHDNGICFLGEKMHGKTSFLLSTLATSEAHYVTNDDVTIDAKDGMIEGIGWPRAISVRKDSVGLMNSVLNKYSFEISFSHPDNSIEDLSGSYFYYVNELAGIFKCDIVPKAKVDCFIYLQFTDEDFCVVEVTGEDKKKLLQRFVDPEVSKYFLDFKGYFGNCENLLTDEIVQGLENIPFYIVSQNIKKMDEVQGWIEGITK